MIVQLLLRHSYCGEKLGGLYRYFIDEVLVN